MTLIINAISTIARSAWSSPRFGERVRPSIAPISVGLEVTAPHGCAAEDSSTGVGVSGLACATAELRSTELAAMAVAHNNVVLIMAIPFRLWCRSLMVSAITPIGKTRCVQYRISLHDPQIHDGVLFGRRLAHCAHRATMSPINPVTANTPNTSQLSVVQKAITASRGSFHMMRPKVSDDW
jgi:hypothetical protein